MAPKKADKKPAAKTTKPAAEKKKTKKKAKARGDAAHAGTLRAASTRRGRCRAGRASLLASSHTFSLAG